MLLESVCLSGFRCFGPESTVVKLADEVTAVVGPNASGKTALLHALTKLFGISGAQRGSSTGPTSTSLLMQIPMIAIHANYLSTS